MQQFEIIPLDFNIPANLEFKSQSELNKFIKRLKLNRYSVDGLKLICSNIIVIDETHVVKSEIPITKSALLKMFTNFSLSIVKSEKKI